MNREDIIRMAQECQLIGMRPHLDGIYEEAFERFAALVAAAEREACAKEADHWQDITDRAGRVNKDGAYIAAAIRARGQT